MNYSSASNKHIFTNPIDDITYEQIDAFCKDQVKEDIDLDYKVDWPTDLDKLLCAFANTQGGLVLIGVDEVEKSRLPDCPPIGIKGKPETIYQKIMNIAFDAVFPPLVPEVKVCKKPNTIDHYVVVIRISPSRLMHAVDRRTRIYIRVADNNRGYSLASISDLQWLWNNREREDKFREQSRGEMLERSESIAIEWANSSAVEQWNSDVKLNVTIEPMFPGQVTAILPSSLLGILSNIGVIESNLPKVSKRIPCRNDIWRCIPGGIAVSHRGYPLSGQQYLEIGFRGQFYGIFTLGSNPIQNDEIRCNYIQPYVILAYVDLVFRFLSDLYNETNLRIWLKVEINLTNVENIRLWEYSPDNEISKACPNNSVNIFTEEIDSLKIESGRYNMTLNAMQELFWIFGFDWTKENVEVWLDRQGFK